jgi:hypothetical protein
MEVYTLYITFGSICNRSLMILIMFNSVSSAEVSLIFVHVRYGSFRRIRGAGVLNFRSLQAYRSTNRKMTLNLCNAQYYGCTRDTPTHKLLKCQTQRF